MHPIFLLLFSLSCFFYYCSIDGYHSVMGKHWGTHLDSHSFLHHGYINSFLATISSSFSDRMHRIHPHGVVVFSPLLSAFNLINNNGVILIIDYSGFIC